jgi:hypothetical protein
MSKTYTSKERWGLSLALLFVGFLIAWGVSIKIHDLFYKIKLSKE